MNSANNPERRCALAIAHPGHEIRVHGWMAVQRPLVYLLTDGSGRRNLPRLNSTDRLLEAAGARRGCLFGPFGDRHVYGQVLAGNIPFFLELSERMALDWTRHQIDLVVGDAYEGSIMSHDLWRGVIDRAVEIVQQTTGRVVENLEFSLESHPLPPRPTDPSIHSIRRLDADAWRRKIEAAESYLELRDEIRAAFSEWGLEAFQFETLHVPAEPRARPDWQMPPEYERHGERQVDQGFYSQVVRYRQHVKPILDALSTLDRAA